MLAIVGGTIADTIYNPPPAQSYKPAPYKEPIYDVKYAFQYEVADDYAGLNYNHNEARDGYITNGGYSVLLPGKDILLRAGRLLLLVRLPLSLSLEPN